MGNIYHVSVSNRGDAYQTKSDNFYNRIRFVYIEYCCSTGEKSNMKIRGDPDGSSLIYGSDGYY